MMRMTTTFKRIVILGLFVIAGACAPTTARKPPVGTPEPDRFLYDRGKLNLEQKRWAVSREYFRQLVDSYPQSQFRASAKLGIGDTYMGEHSAESFVLALNEFREFLSFYPTHELAYYAQFKIAMAHFYQMKAPMRDQTETRDAIRELQGFLTRYPTSPLVDEGKQHLREAKDRLDQWDLGVGVMYYKLKWYPGAIGRISPLVKSDPEFTNRDEAYYYLGESFMRINQKAQALPFYEQLVKEFDKSDYLEAAKKRIEELKATTPAAPGKATGKGLHP
jgi:outer membrane protein assembly factor BamD